MLPCQRMASKTQQKGKREGLQRFAAEYIGRRSLEEACGDERGGAAAVTVSAKQCRRVYYREVGDGRVRRWGRRAYDRGAEDDGEDGLDCGKLYDYDIIILDLMLPGMDGFDVCKKIREHKQIPILMVSAKKDDVDKIRGLGLGADDYMTKPFSPSELVARVKAHL